MKRRLFFSLMIGIIFGIGVGYIDSRPHWDDSGITALMIVIINFICNYTSPGKAIIIGISVAVWTPLFNIILHNNYGSMIVFVPAFIGAFTGSLLKKGWVLS